MKLIEDAGGITALPFFHGDHAPDLSIAPDPALDHCRLHRGRFVLQWNEPGTDDKPSIEIACEGIEPPAYPLVRKLNEGEASDRLQLLVHLTEQRLAHIQSWERETSSVIASITREIAGDASTRERQRLTLSGEPLAIRSETTELRLRFDGQWTKWFSNRATPQDLWLELCNINAVQAPRVFYSNVHTWDFAFDATGVQTLLQAEVNAANAITRLTGKLEWNELLLTSLTAGNKRLTALAELHVTDLQTHAQTLITRSEIQLHHGLT